MIGLAIGAAAMQVASSVYGGVSGIKAARDKDRMLASQKRANKRWYERRYNEDSTQRADAQGVLTKLNEAAKTRSEASNGRSAVMGSSTEGKAVVGQQNANMISNTTSNIASNSSARKDRLDERYKATERGIDNAMFEQKLLKNKNLANTVQQASSAGGALMNMASTWDKNREE